ncbi:FUSC family protein [Alicyclobacillus dauci]|uniref:FUSC family protein n=1 Tax=Alicyclobacillus dauci TaxID=1475485 RepID=A0ABY6Z646_9BACL|nr:FUSC family protein [Alicyclobacillus dauci]WAH37661.1 FUSC family protein [Alicyclobacillus dauci]
MMWRKGTFRGLDDITKHDRTKLRTVPALYNAIAIAIPLIVGVASSHILSGLGIAIGALVTAFSGMTGTSRKRLRTMLIVSVWTAVATFLGAWSGGTAWLVVILIVLSGFTGGMMTAVSATAGQVGVLTTNALIIISRSPQDLTHSLESGLFVFAGGMLQILMMIISDVFRNVDEETKAVMSVYRAIGEYAVSRSRQADLQVASSLLEVDTALNDSYVRKQEWQKLRVLAELGELIRIDIVTLTRLMKTEQNKSGEPNDDANRISHALRHVAAVMTAIADGLGAHKMRDLAGHDSLAILEGTIRDMTHSQQFRGESDTDRCLHQLYSKIGQVVDVLYGESLSPAYAVAYAPHRSETSQLRRMTVILRSNLSFRSSYFRHALRLAVGLTIASIIYRTLPFDRGYWLPLTTGIILKADFFSTFSRGIARVLGTLAGVLVATLLAAIPDPSHAIDIILVLLFAWAMYTVVNFNFALFSFFVTSEIIVLMSFFQNSTPLATITARVIDTFIGCLLALVIYILWPTWQRQNVSMALADTVAAVRTYYLAVVDPYSSSHRIQTARKQARLARTNAAGVIDQFLREPVEFELDAYAVSGLLTAVHRFSDTLLSLESGVDDDRALLSNEEVVVWAGEMGRVLARSKQCCAERILHQLLLNAQRSIFKPSTNSHRLSSH